MDHIEPERAVQSELREAGGVEVAKILQPLGLPLIAGEKDHRQGDIVGEGAGDLPGKGVVRPRLHGQLHRVLPAAGLKDGGHPLHIGLGHHPHHEGGGIGRQVGGGQLGGPLRRQGVLALEDVLHPVGDGADLAVDIVAHIVYRVPQIVVVLGDPVQLGKQVEQAHHKGDHSQRGAEFDKPPPLGRRGLGLCGQVAVHDLLNHGKLLLGQLAGDGL